MKPKYGANMLTIAIVLSLITVGVGQTSQFVSATTIEENEVNGNGNIPVNTISSLTATQNAIHASLDATEDIPDEFNTRWTQPGKVEADGGISLFIVDCLPGEYPATPQYMLAEGVGILQQFVIGSGADYLSMLYLVANFGDKDQVVNLGVTCIDEDGAESDDGGDDGSESDTFISTTTIVNNVLIQNIVNSIVNNINTNVTIITNNTNNTIITPVPDNGTTNGNTTIPDGNTTIPNGNTTIPNGNTTEPIEPNGNTTEIGEISQGTTTPPENTTATTPPPPTTTIPSNQRFIEQPGESCSIDSQGNVECSPNSPLINPNYVPPEEEETTTTTTTTTPVEEEETETSSEEETSSEGEEEEEESNTNSNSDENTEVTGEQ